MAPQSEQIGGRPLFFWAASLLGAVVLGFYTYSGMLIVRYGRLIQGPDVSSMLTLLGVSAAFFAMGMLMGLHKPDEHITRLGCVTGLLTALQILGQALVPFRGQVTSGEAIPLTVMSSVVPWHLVLGYQFFSRFPMGARQGRFRVFLGRFIAIYGFLVFLPRTTLVLLTTHYPGALDDLDPTAASLLALYRANGGWIEALFLLIAVGAMCGVLAANFQRVTDPGQYLRVRWVAYGAVVGFAPIVLYSLTSVVLITSGNSAAMQSSGFRALRTGVNLFAMAIPATLAYAVVKHRILGINVVIRLGIRYLLAKNVLRLILLLPLLAIVFTIASHPDQTVAQVLFKNSFYFYVFLAATAGLSLRFRRQLSRWLDSRFFRESYDSEGILLDLIDRVKQVDSVLEVSQLVGTQLESALHPKCVYICFRAALTSDMNVSYSSCCQKNILNIPSDNGVLQFLQFKKTAQEFPFPRSAGLPQSEVEWLSGLGVQLVVPIAGSDNVLIGLLLLGEKKSEQAYTTADRSTLQVMAGQIAVVLENLRLRERVEVELRSKRNVLQRLEGQERDLLRECPLCGRCFGEGVTACSLDGTELVHSLPVGRIIDGKYRLDQLLGKGGAGAVYEAADLRLNRKVAVKIMTGDLFGNRTALRRFEREAQASAGLRHPNIITVYDFGMIHGEGAYLVMELAPGFTWRSALNRNGTIPTAQLADWMDQLLDGVGAAHSMGVVHRDLKPENVLITQVTGRQLVKVLDFGLAKLRYVERSGLETLTPLGSVLGTLGYIPPEQFTSGDVDERGDVFSLGVMTAEALTGQLPFRGATTAELLRSLLNDPYHLEGSSEEVRSLDDVLQRCLAKDPALRTQSVAELRGKLVPAIRACPPLSPHRREGSSTTDASTTVAGV